MKISNIILVSFFLILLLFSLTTYINYKQAGLISENAGKFERSSVIVRHSNRFQRNFLNMVSGLRGYLLTNETSFIQTYDSAVVENKEILGELRAVVPDGTDQKIILDDIRELQSYWIDEFATPLLEAKRSSTASSQDKQLFNELYREKLVNGLEKDVQKSLQKKFSDFTNIEYGYRTQNREALASSVTTTSRISFYLTVFSVIIGGCIAIFIAYYISSKIVNMVNMANAIAEGNYSVSVSHKGSSELSRLSEALNNMAATLSSTISILKRQRDELDQFAHIVSHDLKAPLRGIDNVAAWIEEDHSFALPPKVNEYLTIIKGRIRRAELLLNGILSYARAGREERSLEIVEVSALLAEVREYLPHKPDVILEVQPNMPTLYTERVPLLQVFTNLIVNAFKYHKKDGGKVKVYYKAEGNFFVFYVEDDGIGIHAQYHQRIFHIFKTLQETESMDSVGVGLAIVKKILDDRGLFIHLDSEPGRGSIFSFNWRRNDIEEKSN